MTIDIHKTGALPEPRGADRSGPRRVHRRPQARRWRRPGGVCGRHQSHHRWDRPDRCGGRRQAL